MAVHAGAVAAALLVTVMIFPVTHYVITTPTRGESTVTLESTQSQQPQRKSSLILESQLPKYPPKDIMEPRAHASTPARPDVSTDRARVESTNSQTNVNKQVSPPSTKSPAEIDALFKQDATLWAELKAARCNVDWAPAVQHELANWKDKGFTLQDVEHFCVKRVFRLSYVHGEMRIARYNLDGKNIHRVICGHWLIYMATMRAAARGNPIPPFELNIQPGDSAFSTGRVQWNNAAPLLSNIKCGGASVSFPLTLHDQFGNGFGHMSLSMYKEKYDTAVQWEMDTPAWSKKKPAAIFAGPRGSGSRGNRSRLFKLKSSALHITSDSTTVRDMAEYQGNIYAYGHCGWSRRVHELATMDTVVFMEDSICREYFHAMFEPGVDHVAVAEDFSDLVTKAEDMFKRPKDAEAMAAAWYTKGKQLFSLVCVLDYVDALLRAYADLQRFDPEYHSSWPEYHPNETHDFFRSEAAALPTKACQEPVMFKGVKSHKC
eukprot:m.208156 g.208156  ORF g.208156 m.208156 type:complete len:489 (+) comp24036_c0_seq1:41-1507(+)